MYARWELLRLSELVTLTINGNKYTAEKGRFVLQVAREHGIKIPSLCHLDAVEPYGACRLCIVEVTKGTRNRIVTSCLYPVEEGLVIQTDSPRVRQNRKMLLDLLYARCSENSVIKELAAEYGLEKPSYAEEYWTKEDCIVCGLCCRVCEQVVGVSAISLVNRGVTKEPASPFLGVASDCIGCGSCFYSCPTNAIKMEDKGGFRYIYNWNIKYKLQKCSKCGIEWAPVKQLEYIQKKWKLPKDFFGICPYCRGQ
jgi:NADH dehydrogenase/NADH:ubiquinone oxidoreductase subunit G